MDWVESRWGGVESRWVEVESRWVGVESRWVGVESRWIGVESRWVGVESRWVSLKSRGATDQVDHGSSFFEVALFCLSPCLIYFLQQYSYFLIYWLGPCYSCCSLQYI